MKTTNRLVTTTFILALLTCSATVSSEEKTVRNANLAPVPVVAPISGSKVYIAFPYQAGADFTHYGIFMGAQWGRRGTGFILEWGLAPGHMDVGEAADNSGNEPYRRDPWRDRDDYSSDPGNDAVKFGATAHLAMGMRIKLFGKHFSQFEGSNGNFGMALTLKGLAAASFIEDNEFKPQAGGSAGLTAEFTYSLFDFVRTDWLLFGEWNALYGDLVGGFDTGLDIMLLRVGVGSVLTLPKAKKSSMLVSIGSMLDIADSSAPYWFGAVGVVW
jgi:hypothetical protein